MKTHPSFERRENGPFACLSTFHVAVCVWLIAEDDDDDVLVLGLEFSIGFVADDDRDWAKLPDRWVVHTISLIGDTAP